MSGASEATAVIANRDLFTINSTAPAINPAASKPQLEQQMHVSYALDGAAGFRQVASSPPPFQTMPTGTTLMSHLNSDDQKGKRGRPRKYGPDGSLSIPLSSPQQSINVAVPQQQPQTFYPHQSVQAETHSAIDGSASPTMKKARGRPRGSRNKKRHVEALGSNGFGFIPHVLNVNTGEDFSSKIMAFCLNGPRAVCVLSANGTISTVTLRQAATSGGTATYEGQFDILSLSGSFMLSEVAGQKSRTGGLSVALAGPNGSVLGGSVAGLLVAASPGQVIVGSFLPDGQKEVSTSYVEPSSVPVKANLGGAAGASSSPSRGTFSESSGGPASPLNLSSGAFNVPQGMSSIPWK